MFAFAGIFATRLAFPATAPRLFRFTVSIALVFSVKINLTWQYAHLGGGPVANQQSRYAIGAGADARVADHVDIHLGGRENVQMTFIESDAHRARNHRDDAFEAQAHAFRVLEENRNIMRFEIDDRQPLPVLAIPPALPLTPPWPCVGIVFKSVPAEL